jgi:hypothetical protein
MFFELALSAIATRPTLQPVEIAVADGQRFTFCEFVTVCL